MRRPTSEQVAAIVAAASKGDVVVVCPAAASLAGRKLMRTRLCHAGLSPAIAAVLGWATTAPGDDAPIITRIEASPEQDPGPDDVEGPLTLPAFADEPEVEAEAPQRRSGKGRR